jgi:hypothetical protein
VQVGDLGDGRSARPGRVPLSPTLPIARYTRLTQPGRNLASPYWALSRDTTSTLYKQIHTIPTPPPLLQDPAEHRQAPHRALSPIPDAFQVTYMLLPQQPRLASPIILHAIKDEGR